MFILLDNVYKYYFTKLEIATNGKNLQSNYLLHEIFL